MSEKPEVLDAADFERLLEAALLLAGRAFSHGIADMSLPEKDCGCGLFDEGIALLLDGMDMDTVGEILATLLSTSGPDFQRSPVNRAAVEAVTCIALGDDPKDVRERLLTIKGGQPPPAPPRPATPAPSVGDGPMVIRGDLSSDDGALLTDRDVTVIGNVHDGCVLKTSRSVTVTGQVGSARLECRGNASIAGCVHGKGQGTIRCGGDLRARSLERVTVDATGDVRVASGIVHSHVRCGGDIVCKGQSGAIFGGSVEAAGSVEAVRLGAPFCDGTRVAAGVSELRAGASDPAEDGATPTVSVSDRIFEGVRVLIGASAFSARSELVNVRIRSEGFSLRVDRVE